MRIVAYIDQSPYAPSVCQHAVWAAQRLQLPIELVHAIELPGSLVQSDFSGYFAIDAPETVLEDRVKLDEMQNRVLVDEGHRLLDTAAVAIRSEGVSQISERLFQGTITEHLHQHHEEAVLVVVGRRGVDAERDPTHLGSNIERVVRSAHRPVLIATKTFEPIDRSVIAWDGGRSVSTAVQFITSTPLLSGVETTLLHAGDLRGGEDRSIEAVQSQLRAADVPAEIMRRPGAVSAAIVAVVTELPAQLVVMGAYGHSRIKHLVLGSTTTEVLLNCPGSMLVFH